ncbi:MAG: DUF2309 domain-containing protein [Candidatus Sericytochromatia bacterium]
MTVKTTSSELDARRAALRSDVRLAARVLPTHYPLRTFIAVNPLAGLQTMPFEQALRRAGDLYGTRGTLPEAAFRDLYWQGRITDADLDQALTRRYPNLRHEQLLRLGGRNVSPAELLRADLLYGAGTPEPSRRYRTRAEQLNPAVADTVDAQTAKWCAAFFGEARWPMPGRDAGFYAAWRALAPADRTLPRTVRRQLRSASGRPEDAALDALERLAVGADARVTYLQAHLTRLPGWAAHVQWCADRDTGVDLLQYLAVRLTYEALLLRPCDLQTADAPRQALPSARQRVEHVVAEWGLAEVSDAEIVAAARVLAALPVTAREMIWQNAYESHYRDALLDALHTHEPSPRGPASVQLVGCIDTRSEGLRRHLEAVDGYQTFGFAGFFAVAIRFTDLLGGAPADLCPVLISPSHDVTETAAPCAARAAKNRLAGTTRLAGAEEAFHHAKDALAAPYALAEAAGWAAAPLAAAKTLAPGATGALRRRLRDVMAPPAPTELEVDAIPLAERVLFAQAALTTMGLTRDFCRLVVLCAHGASTENNPYQAALDCGACGGQAGGPNARTAAAILNQGEVRDGLRTRGIDIPAQTHFIAAQHDTATDRVLVLDMHLVPGTHRGDVRQLQEDLAHAGAALAAERCASLPGAPRGLPPEKAARHVATRSVDWGQVYPEWGLAGNAAFVAAPREITRGLDLSRRAFLHSYEADVDPDGTALETIMTAPLVVAQWINCQYYFSTVAPDVFGAGTKTIHNVVGNVGVIAGHVGDLRLGLPWQSVADGERLLHEPQRLLAVVQAPLSRIDAIIDRNPMLQELLGNDWIALAAREGPGQPWQRWTRGGWRSWDESNCSPMVLEKETAK